MSDEARHVIRVRSGSGTTETLTDKRELVIGSAPEADIRIESPEISPRHALLRIDGDRLIVRDLGSRTGTFHGTSRLEGDEERELELCGTELAFGGAASVVVGRIAYDSQAGMSELQRLMDAKARSIDRLREEIGTIAGEHSVTAKMLAAMQKELGAGERSGAERVGRAEETLKQLRLESQRIELEKERVSAELAELRNRLESEKVGLEGAVREHKHEDQVLAAVKATLEETREAVERMKSELTRVTLESEAAERRRAALEEEALSLRRSSAEAEGALEAARVEAVRLQGDIERFRAERLAAVSALEEAVVRSKRELEVHALEERKRQAVNETREAEFKERSLALEVAIHELELKRVSTEKEFAAVQDGKIEAERRLAAAAESTRELAGKAAEGEARLAKAEAAVAAAEKERERLAEEVRSKRDALTREIVDQAQKMKLDLAESHRKELERLDKIKSERELLLRANRDYIVDDLATYVVELGRASAIDFNESEVRATVQGALEGKSVASLNTKALQRTRRFWKRIGLVSAGPVAIALTLVFFPQLPHLLARSLFKSVASGPDNGGVFLQQIREKGMRFQTEMDRSYRATYADNVLYLEGYAEMKLDDGEQRKWTIDLNDFLTGRLGLSDRVVVDFIGAEAVLVKELVKARETIVAQYKDQGIARMAEIEKQESTRMLQIFESDDGYAKFRAFEKSYYEDYLGRRRGPASQ